MIESSWAPVTLFFHVDPTRYSKCALLVRPDLLILDEAYCETAPPETLRLTSWGTLSGQLQDTDDFDWMMVYQGRLFAWLGRYRRPNIVYVRAPHLFAGHVWIAMISIISRRIVAQTQTQ